MLICHRYKAVSALPTVRCESEILDSSGTREKTEQLADMRNLGTVKYVDLDHIRNIDIKVKVELSP
jgi:hypothetical protein